jgi:hypothetical protein
MQAQSQEQSKYEWSINLGGGVSTLKYQPAAGSAASGIGGLFGIGYTRFFSSHWGFVTGLEASLYNSVHTLENLSPEYPIAVPAGLQGDFFLRANYAGYEEKQRAMYVRLPLMLQFQSSSFYLGAGVKIGMPVSATSDISVGSVTTSGYSDYTAQVYENMPTHGFDTYSNVKSSDKLDLGISGALALETGFKLGSSFYTGIYFDYGLNSIQKESSHDFLGYNPTNPPDYKYGSILQSQIQGKAFTDKVTPFAVGVKIRLAFGGGGTIPPPDDTVRPVKPVKTGKRETKPVKPEPVYAQ